MTDPQAINNADDKGFTTLLMVTNCVAVVTIANRNVIVLSHFTTQTN